MFVSGGSLLLTVPQFETSGFTVCRHSFVARSQTCMPGGVRSDKSKRGLCA